VTLTAKLAQFFQAHPNVWHSARDLEFSGRQAWRTRVSECRTQLGMTILNRQRTVTNHGHLESWQSRTYVVSEYAFIPSAETQTSELVGHDLNTWELKP
jgi:hypothetical protein